MSDLTYDETLADLHEHAEWNPTPMEEARGVLCSETGCLTARTPTDARVNAATIKGVDDLLRYVEKYPALDLLAEVPDGHPAEVYVRAARSLLELERMTDVPGLARTACAHEREHWRRVEDDLRERGDRLW